jgi:hypothetical protein
MHFTEYNYPFGDGPVWAFRNDTSTISEFVASRELDGEYDKPKP